MVRMNGSEVTYKIINKINDKKGMIYFVETSEGTAYVQSRFCKEIAPIAA